MNFFASAAADLVAFDQLLPRLQQVTERAKVTQFALGSDVMAAALQGYPLRARAPWAHRKPDAWQDAIPLRNIGCAVREGAVGIRPMRPCHRRRHA